MTHERKRQRAFPGTVRSHERVDAPTTHREVQPADDLITGDADVQVHDLKELVAHIDPFEFGAGGWPAIAAAGLDWRPAFSLDFTAARGQ